MPPTVVTYRMLRFFWWILGAGLAWIASVLVVMAQAAGTTATVRPDHAMPLADGRPAAEANPRLTQDADGFVYEPGTEMARMDLREMAKGDYYLGKSQFDQAYACYLTAFETGNRSIYLLAQLGISAEVRGDKEAALRYLAQAAGRLKLALLDEPIAAPYQRGYETPALRAARKPVTLRTGRSVVYYQMVAQAEAADHAGLVATATRFYEPLVRHDKELLCLLAQAYRAQGQYKKALAQLDTALPLPNTPRADNRLVYRLKGLLLAAHLHRPAEGCPYLAKAAALGDAPSLEEKAVYCK